MYYKYFNPQPRTLDELKSMYRKLAMQYHPDIGGDVEIMKQINNEHDRLFEMLKADQNRRADADTTGRTQHTTETAEEFRDIIIALLRIPGLHVELCGRWLWISGDTLKHKDELKALGCRWSQNKKMWSWHHREDGAKWHKTNWSMTHIRSKYGSQVIDDADPAYT